MLPTVIGVYGGPYQDQEVVEDITTQLPSDLFNRLSEDVAQATRTVPRAYVSFQTTIAVAPVVVPVVDATSVWGDGSGQHPTVTKSGTGVYLVQYAATYQDALGFDEPVSLRWSAASFAGNWFGMVICHIVSPTSYLIRLADHLAAASDFGGDMPVTSWCR